MISEKISANEIKITKTENNTTEATYTYEYLITQKAAIEAQKAEQIAARDKEIADVDAMLAECVKLGIKEKIVEITI